MRIALLICGLLFWAVDAAAQDICEAVNPATPCVGAVAPGDTQISVHAAAGATNGAISISVKLTRAGGAESMTIPAAPTGTGLYAAGVTPALNANDMIAVQVASSTQPAITLGPIFVPAANTSTLYVLGLVGINATGASSSGASQQYFAEFDMIAPWNCRDGQIAHALQHKCWLWLNPRIASVPSASSTALTTLGSSASSLAGGLTSKTAGQIAQTMEFQGGVEFYLRSPWEGAQFGRNHSWDRTAISFIAGGGVVTPFSPASSAPRVRLERQRRPAVQSESHTGVALSATGFGLVQLRIHGSQLLQDSGFGGPVHCGVCAARPVAILSRFLCWNPLADVLPQGRLPRSIAQSI
jgi:hypothetical protein